MFCDGTVKERTRNDPRHEIMEKLYVKIKALCDERGITPSELARNLGFSKNFFTELKSDRVKSCSALRLSAIADYFGVDADTLLRDGERPRVRIPVYGKVAAGIPIDAIEDICGYEEITPELAATGRFIALAVKGDSMSPVICNGDTILIRLQSDADTGDTVVAMVNGGEATCKRIKKEPGGVWLLPNNPDYEPMFFSNDEIESLPVTILGKVTELRRSF